MSVEQIERIAADIMKRKEKATQEKGAILVTEEGANKARKGNRFIPTPAPPSLPQRNRPEEEEQIQQTSPDQKKGGLEVDRHKPVSAPLLAPTHGVPYKTHQIYIPLNTGNRIPYNWVHGHPTPLTHPQLIQKPIRRFRHPIGDPMHPLNQGSSWQPPSPPIVPAAAAWPTMGEEHRQTAAPETSAMEDWLTTGDERAPITVPVPIAQSKAKPAKKRIGTEIARQGKQPRLGYRANRQWPAHDSGVEPSEDSDGNRNDRLKKRYTRASNANYTQKPKKGEIWVFVGGKMALASIWGHNPLSQQTYGPLTTAL